MIYLNSKADQNMHIRNGLAKKIFILMTNGIGSVSEQKDCNIDATQERSNLKGCIKGFQKVARQGAAALAVIGASTTAACASCAQAAVVLAPITAKAAAP